MTVCVSLSVAPPDEAVENLCSERKKKGTDIWLYHLDAAHSPADQVSKRCPRGALWVAVLSQLVGDAPGHVATYSRRREALIRAGLCQKGGRVDREAGGRLSRD